MRPTRRSQPYRRNTGRHPGGALSAMLRGSAAYSANPQDVNRRTQRMARRPGADGEVNPRTEVAKKRRRKRHRGLSAVLYGS